MDATSAQIVKCGWRSCAQQFGSEIDMNMHVLMNHMMILEHGEFTLNKRAVSRKRQGEPLQHAPIQVRPPPVQVVNFKPTPEVRAPPPELRTPPVIIRQPEAPRVPDQTVQLPRVIMPVLPPRAPPPQFNERGEKKPDLSAMIRLLSEKTEFPPDTAPGPSGLNRQNEDLDVEEITMGKYYGGPHEQRKLSDVVDEFLERLKPMKQLGFIRPNKTVYCIVCLKYVRSFHECNWKHSPSEDRIVEMWFRRFGPEKPTGKNQLIGELMEVKAVILAEETERTDHNTTF